MLTISNLSVSASDTDITATGVVLGETIMVHAPPGTRLHTSLTTGIHALYIGNELYASRSIRGQLGHTNTSAEFPEFYEAFKNTPMIEHNVRADAINSYTTKTQTNLFDLKISTDAYSSILGDFFSIAGICTDKDFNIYVFVLGEETPPIKTMNIFKYTVGGTEAEIIWRSKGFVKNQGYTKPNYFISHGIEYITFSGGGSVDYLFDIQKKQMHVDRPLPGQNPTRSVIYEIDNVLVSDMYISNSSGSGSKIYLSNNGMDWMQIPEIHYGSTDPGNPNYGFFGNTHKIQTYFRDPATNRLCLICVPAKSSTKMVVYYTDNGVVWKEGITIRDAVHNLTWQHDSATPGVFLGDDYIETASVMGNVVFVAGHWYVGWTNTGNGDGHVPILTRFSNYTLTGSSGLEHAMGAVTTRQCATDLSGPPALVTRYANQLGFILDNDEWVALWKTDPTKYSLGYWYYDNSVNNSVGWNSIDSYAKAPQKIMAKSDIPAYFQIIANDPNDDDFSSIPDYEIRTLVMAKCFNSDNTSLTDITLNEAVYNTVKVGGAGENLMYTTGPVEGAFAANFSNSGLYGSDGTQCWLVPLPGYNPDWDSMHPITRLI